jgi:hypothetical protein
MRSADFIMETMSPDDITSLALTYLDKMLGNGLTSAAAINNVIDILLLKGVNHTLAASAAKQAYATISGKDFLA